MRVSFVATGLLSLAGLINGLDVADLDTFEDLKEIPREWNQLDRAPASKRLHFRIAVTPPTPKLLEQTLYSVSTPGNPRYGKHLKRDELKEMLRPVPEATAGILEWLHVSGIKQEDIQDDDEWINFVASVAQAEKMMDTNFHVYESTVKPVQK
ncbi:hypothetical protein LTS18_000920, partial [Coniosporium uncinatum]